MTTRIPFDELWTTALSEIELSVSKANFQTWFKDTSILEIDNGKVTVGVPNGFAKEWLEKRFRDVIINVLRKQDGSVNSINCIVRAPRKQDKHEKNAPVQKLPSAQPHTSSTPTPSLDTFKSNLNDRYTFDSLVVGEHNELAVAACNAVCRSLGTHYNPLFIYGGVGLGKTHLLQSVGNEVLRHDPSKKVYYVTSERFTNALIESIKTKTVDSFKEFYQNIDVLIVDDVQFLAGKEKTQNEFFHIFNTLYQFNKQIILSSDRPAKAISMIEDRLRSRFEGGMITDVSRPDLETRMAIIRTKAQERGIDLEDEAIEYIATNIKNNIREIEGALNKIAITCDFTHTEPSKSIVESTLNQIVSHQKKQGVQSKDVIDVVSEYYGVSDEALISKGRKKQVVVPRQVAMYLLHTELDMSLPNVGEVFGGRDHTTVLHGVRKIEKELSTSEKRKEEVTYILDQLYRV